MPEPSLPAAPPGHWREVARVFLRLGLLAFGGPAAHIALMEEELVRRRRWVTHEEFVDLLGATNLIPGPNSTEMAIHLGHVRAGFPGLLAAGVCFIAPAMLLVLALAWAYVRFGALPAAAGLLYGIKPVMIAVVLQALWNLGRTVIKGALGAVVGVAVLGLFLAGVNELVLLFGGALVFAVAVRARRGAGLHALVPLGVLPLLAPAAVPVSTGRLFLAFLKIGSVLYGSGYVLLAFLRNDFVERLHWITNRQLLDAVSVGQFTPGPVFTTATFVGYLVAGAPRAVVATVGIFLPSFVFVALTGPLIPRLRRSSWTAPLLDGVNVAALGLMAAVALELARAAFVDLPTVAMGVGAAVLLLRFKVNSTWLILGGAAVGVVLALGR